MDTTTALPSMDDLLSGKSVPSISFKDAKIGTSYTGTITDAEVAQVRNYETGEPEFWEDGNKKVQIVVTLATDYVDPSSEEDDGTRKVYLFGQKLAAAKAALKASGMSKLEIGTKFTITFESEKPASNKKYNNVKVYSITLEKGTSNPGVDALLSAGAKEVAAPAASGTLTDKQIATIKALSEGNFSDDEIAEQLGLDIKAVVSVTAF